MSMTTPVTPVPTGGKVLADEVRIHADLYFTRE